ncbi:Uncharacterized membrane protein [Friedmanniella luteola]|uniref:Uncharacterized membrane protein n=1 Tax=Friedmanniella luteola TaxID=546871 RepID=A0A1H2A7F8_9ACTN|nr:TMEM175 family protein [Friedmanniella luteola]SDT41814.1 Uncharacterized membrane protein [Friedmanniella luteola]
MTEQTYEDATTTRIINFTDAIVAIAATLLILEPIDAAAQAGDQQPLLNLLASTSEQLLAFAVSFVVIGHFWLLHRRLFKSVRVITQPLYWFNLLWLFSIVFLPYPTAVLSGRTDDPPSCALYIGTMTVTSLAALALKVLVARAKAEEGDPEYSAHLGASVAAVAALCAATALALFVPWVQLWGLLLLLPTVWFGRRKGKGAPRVPGAVVGQRIEA